MSILVVNTWQYTICVCEIRPNSRIRTYKCVLVILLTKIYTINCIISLFMSWGLKLLIFSNVLINDLFPKLCGGHS